MERRIVRAQLVAGDYFGVLGVRPTLGRFSTGGGASMEGAQLRPWRLGSWVLGTFALLALGLAVLGVVAATLHAVVERRRELGVRMALGASDRRLVRQLVGRAVALALVGVAGGGAAARSWVAGSPWRSSAAASSTRVSRAAW